MYSTSRDIYSNILVIRAQSLGSYKLLLKETAGRYYLALSLTSSDSSLHFQHLPGHKYLLLAMSLSSIIEVESESEAKRLPCCWL